MAEERKKAIKSREFNCLNFPIACINRLSLIKRGNLRSFTLFHFINLLDIGTEQTVFFFVLLDVDECSILGVLF